MEVKTRKQALADGDKYYFTGKPCPQGHVSLRRVKQKDCLECHNLYMQAAKGNGKKATWDRNYIKNNPVKRKEKRYRQKKRRESLAGYSEFDDFVASECIALCSLRKEETGVDWHIDHMIPLNARQVSGLHIADNLQVIPAQMNLEKGNKLWYTERYQFTK